MSSPTLPAHLNNHQRNTLRQIFQHPAGHNIDAAEAQIDSGTAPEIPEVPPTPQLPSQASNGKLAAAAAAQPGASARHDHDAGDPGA